MSLKKNGLFAVLCLYLLISPAVVLAQKASANTTPAPSVAPTVVPATPMPAKPAVVSEEYDPTSKPKQAPITTNSGVRTLIWEVTAKNGNTAYLFGTIHVGKASFYPLPDVVEDAFKRSAKLVVEANIMDQRDGAEIARMVELPKGETIEKHIPAKLVARLKTQLAKNNIPYTNVANMRPVMLGGLLPIVEFVKLGYEMNQGLDLKLIERAQAEKKPILELESSLGQIKLLTGMSPLLQEAFLENAIASIEQGKGAGQVERIVKAWQMGDAKLLADTATEVSKEGRMADTLNEHLLAGRHPAMVDKIEGYLATNETHFIAVGSLHLVGVGGLVEMLRSLGYLVRQL